MDFTRPTKFTTDQERRIRRAMDTFTERATTRLAAEHRTAMGSTTLRELFEMVGVDVARYFFLMRKPEAQVVFDLELALDQSEKNPVYKVQYAHALRSSRR